MTRKRKFLLAVFCLIGLGAAVLGGGAWWLNGDGFDRYATGKLIERLKQYGIEAEIGALDIRPFRLNADLRDVRLRLAGETKPFFATQHAFAQARLRDLFAGDVAVDFVQVDRPEVALSFDEGGVLNLTRITLPKTEKTAATKPAELWSGRLQLTDGSVTVNDKQFALDTDIKNLRVGLEPAGANQRWSVAFSDGRVKFGDKTVAGIDFDTKAVVYPAKADIESLELGTPYGKTTVAGNAAWKTEADGVAVSYDANVFSAIDLKKVAADFLPGMALAGTAKLSAKVRGDQKNLQVAGDLAPMNLTAAGANLTALRTKYEVATPLMPALAPTVESQVAFGALAYNGVTVEDFSARVAATMEKVDVAPFAAKTLGGTVKGETHIELPDRGHPEAVPGRSSAKVEFTDLNLGGALALGSPRPLPLAGKITGKADLAWPGLDYVKAAGESNVTVTGNVTGPIKASVKPADSSDSQPSDSPNPQTPSPIPYPLIPFTSDVTARIVPGGADITKLAAKCGAATIEATGTFRQPNQGKFDVKYHTTDLAEAQALGERFGFSAPSLSGESGGVKFAVGGAGDFVGTIAGNLSAPNVAGTVSLAEVRAGQQVIGKFAADFESTPATVTVKQAELLQPDGGRLTVAFAGALTGTQTSNLRLTLADINLKNNGDILSKIEGFEGIGKSLIETGGNVSGNFDLAELPSLETVKTLAKTPNLQNEEFRAALFGIRGNGELTTRGTQTKYGPVDQSKLRFSSDGDKLYRLDELAIRFPGGTLAAKGNYNAETDLYELDAQARDIDVAAFGDALKAKGYPLTGRASFDLVSKGKAETSLKSPKFTLTARSGAVAAGNLKFTDSTVSAVGEKGEVGLTIATKFLDRPYTSTGKVVLNYDDEDGYLPTIEAGVKIDRAPIVPVLAAFGVTPKNVSGEITGTATLRGPLYETDADGFPVLGTKNVKIFGDFSALRVSVRPGDDSDTDYVVVNDGPLKLSAGLTEIVFDQCRLKDERGENTRLNISGTINTSGKTALGLDGDVDLKLLRTFSSGYYSSGIAHLKATVAGTVDEPRLTGTADVDDMAFRIPGVPVGLEHGGGRILFNAKQAQIETFTADANGGKVELSGGFLFENFKAPRWRFGIRADNVRVVYPRDVRSLADGDLVLQGNPRVQVLSGTVKVKRSEYTTQSDLATFLQNVASYIPSGGPGTSLLPGTGAQAAKFSLDVAVEAPDALVLHNNFADVVGSASMRLRGPLDDLKVIGSINVLRGTVDFRSDRYQVTRGVVRFPEARSEPAFFDVQLETDVRGYRVILGIAGSGDKPATVTLRSEPSLPQVSILTLLATGNVPPPGSAANQDVLNSQASVNAASTILSQLLTEKVEERTGKLLGLNRLQIDPLLIGRGNDPTARLTIGRRVTKDLTITYSTNLTSAQEQVILVEYRVAKNVSIIGLRDQFGNFGFDVRFTKRF